MRFAYRPLNYTSWLSCPILRRSLRVTTIGTSKVVIPSESALPKKPSRCGAKIVELMQTGGAYTERLPPFFKY